MALAALSGDAQCIIFCQLCNALDPGVAVAFSSTSNELWALTPALPGSKTDRSPVWTVECRVPVCRRGAVSGLAISIRLDFR